MPPSGSLLRLTPTGDGVRFEVRVVPRAGRDRLDGVRNGALRVRLAAPPVDGAANYALIAFLAATLGIPKRDVLVLRGERARDKQLFARGLTVEELRQRLSTSGAM